MKVDELDQTARHHRYRESEAYFDRRLMRDLRKGNGMTLRDLQELTGLSNPYLSQLETGRVQNPTIAAAVAIADAFGLGVQTFILRRARPPKRKPRSKEGRGT